MADLPVALEGRNLGLCILLSALWIALLLLFAGPGRIVVAEAREAAGTKEARTREWDERFSNVSPLSAAEYRSWVESVAELREFGASGDDELGLTTWVAATLRAPSLRGLEVIRDSERDEGEEIELRSPDGESRLSLTPVFVSVRFESDYADLSRLLARIEAPQSGLAIRRLEVTRHLLNVRVQIDLDLWTRRGIES